MQHSGRGSDQEAGQRHFLRDGHAAHRVILLEDQDVEAGAGEVEAQVMPL